MKMFKNLAKVALCLCALPAFAANRTNVVEGVTIVIFDEPGTFNFVPDENIASARMLLVGGGGGGGGIQGGGGGGGQVLEVASAELEEGVAYAVTVGDGGAAIDTGKGVAGQGGTSSLIGSSLSYSAIGGGGGYGEWSTWLPGGDGANGGGAGGNGTGIKSGGSALIADGHKGGCSGSGGGGGGGMAEDGYDATNKTSKVRWGGAGVTNNITGTYVMYGYGGGGGNGSNAGKGGANNAYGNGGYQSGSDFIVATAGEDGTGGGGGGGCGQGIGIYGADGGCGTVIISYTSAKKMPAEFSISGYTGWVDGKSHTVTVTPIWPSEYTLEYSLNGTTSFSSEIPQITAAGSNEVFVAMSGDTCTRTVKSAVVWLVQKGDTLLNQYTATGSHTFTTPASIIADILVVGGGGSGSGYGGGGGGGFVIYKEGVILPKDATCAITVGEGGASVSAGNGNAGASSRLVVESAAVDYLAPGGGYGGGGWSNVKGGDGGNGGGAGGNGQTDTIARVGGASTVSGGHKGGDGWADTKGGMGAGGGGMSEDGHPALGDKNGGAGLTNDITGVSVIYGAGGGGCLGGKGGSGDGSGDGAPNGNQKTGVAANPNTGCGGGGAYYQNTSGAGGSGFVAIRYQYLEAVPPVIDDSLHGEVIEDNHLRITGVISYLGTSASSCTVAYYLGTDPDNLSQVGSDTITESGESFQFDSSSLESDVVYYWKVFAIADTSSTKETSVYRVRSCGKWHYEDGIIDDGVWAFAVTADASGNMTIGAWTKYPTLASTLDFTKEITDGTEKEYVITKLNPQFSVIKSSSSYAIRGDCTVSLAAPYLAELRLPTVGLTEIGAAAFANCTSLTNVVPYIPDCVTTLGAGAFASVPAAQDVRIMNVATIQCTVFKAAGLTSVTFGPALKSMISYNSWGSFLNCANLTNVTFDAEMKDGSFGGEYGEFCNCWKLTGTIDVSGFSTLYAANANGPFQNTSYTNIIIGTNVTSLSKLFFTGSSIENIYFEGLPPCGLVNKVMTDTFYTPYTYNTSATKTIKTYVHKDLLAVTNAVGKCWNDYAANGVISHRGTTFALSCLDSSKITDPSVRPLLTVEKPGLVLILR